jgi:mannose-6-phosphate isomerase-like protein (cupin superfamily)
MAGYTVKKIDDMEAIYGGGFKRARAELGVESFGMQVLDLPPNITDQYPEHDHSDDGQEEVYVVLRGAAEIEVEGDTHQLDPDTMVRVGPGVKRRLRTGSEGARVLALGGLAGKPYHAPDMSKLGTPDPLARQSA